jgi:hypothetical protein
MTNKTADKKKNHKIMGLDNHKKLKRLQNKGSRQELKRELWRQQQKYLLGSEE